MEEINPATIRFSQRSVTGLAGIVESMRDRGFSGAPIDVVRMSGGELVTLDNTRLLAASVVGIHLQAIVHEASELLPESQIHRFATSAGRPTTWGGAAAERIRNQGARFSGRYPNGSPYTGVT